MVWKMKSVPPVQHFKIISGVKYVSSNYFASWYARVDCESRPNKTEVTCL